MYNNESEMNALSGLGPDDLAIPEISLIQQTGGYEAKESGAQPGDLYCNVTGDIFRNTGVDIVIARITKQRTYWGRDEISDEPPVCSSLDGIKSVNGDSCDTACPYKAYTSTPWAVSPTERRGLCMPSYTILGIIHTDNPMPVQIRAGGISAQAVRELNSVLVMNRKLKGEYYRAIIHVDSVKKRTASGEAFALTFRLTGTVQNEDLAAVYREQAGLLLGFNLPAISSGESDGYLAPQNIPLPEPPLPPDPITEKQAKAVINKTPITEKKDKPMIKEADPKKSGVRQDEPMPDIDSLSDF